MNENLDIICIGESLIELSTNESLIYAKTLNKFFGGDTMTTAVAASRLGSKVGYITRVGNDYLKDFLLDAWQSEHLDISQIKLTEGFNGLYFISRFDDGKKEFAYYRKKSAATTLNAMDISADYINQAGIVYSSGVTQSLSISAREAVFKAFKTAKENNVKVGYDINFTERLWSAEEAKEAFEEVIEFVDILFVSLKHDINKLYGDVNSEIFMKNMWDKGVSIVVIRNSDGSASVGYNGEVIEIPTRVEKVVDATSSGDAFNGGFMHAFLGGCSPFEAGRLASIVMSFQALGIGAINSLPSKNDVYNCFNNEQ